MTGEEMERAIEFLIDNQARFDARLEETNRQIAETNKRLESFADTQAELLQVVTRTFEAQNRINEEFRHGHEELHRGLENLQRSQDAAWVAIHQTEKSVDRLAETVRRQIEGRGGNSGG